MRVQTAIVGAILLTAATVMAAPVRSDVEVKNGDGTVAGHVIICADCKDPAEAGTPSCAEGALDGWRDGTVCGGCLLRANWSVLVKHDRDLHVTGKLIKPDGNPVIDRFVKIFLPNGWSVRTRTAGDGTFRLMLGATAERKGDEPIVVDVGRRVDSVVGTDEHFAMYLLPPDFKTCPATEPTPGGAPSIPRAF